MFQKSVLISLLFLSQGLLAGEEDRTTVVVGDDKSIEISMRGRAANVELAHSGKNDEGWVLSDYQKGSGYVEYNRDSQTLRTKTRIGYTLNRLARHIVKVAPYMHAYLPQHAVIDFNLNINSMGYCSLNFADLNLSGFNLDVRYGDVDINFPTENDKIFRDEARFHLSFGDLELSNLANLKADKIRINGGAGELTVDFGPKLLKDTEVILDNDIGTTEIFLPKGTKVLIKGTNRDLSAFGFQKVDKVWEPITYSENSPTLNMKMRGPVGDLNIIWK